MKRNLYFALLIAFISTVGCGPQKTQQANTPADSLQNWALLPFNKVDSLNPVLVPGKGSFTDPILETKVLWEEKDVFNPAIVNRNGKIYMLYRAQDKAGTSRIGMAVSSDALHFTRMPSPVFYPDQDSSKVLEWPGGCEDPRIVADDKGTYYMTYTGYDGKVARLLIASSTNLIHWKKYGSVFAKAYNGKYAKLWSKSGSIISTYKDGQPIATKINGKYWMYWGDTQIWTATSDDLINWTPVEMKAGERPPVKLRSQALNMPQLKIALPTREGKFDSDLVESGPPAMITDKGIVLIYNSRNVPSFGDKTLSEGTYAPSEVLFDKNDPTRILRRLDTYFMKPEKPYEITGQVNQVCFVEGLTQFKNNWYLYYGTADSKIAVAVNAVKN
ncbi:glycoside hydrolase family 130 protein [Mucilaginibacter sp. L3T2-6]|uniref:glycoside hydrolase family 130 protein n=1 Tax=Mucilaginibacter sp. L3T2-6 TaxID=3062491 RepID=UPI002676A8F4|nr:glycoside hydrolase family 130 protein [Mucilaginibacter sp. L3T2-6]MDO3645060.1 glycoside hydrolase family 130 protein [Mucilaginibacter sp. L3T2-6]MDV6217511.1 glycoside hydrolase family 130 protein [Mucilaginibacter sp. L3T2-6]